MNVTLRKRILFFNLGTFLIALVIVGVLAFYEFTEQEVFESPQAGAEELESPAFEAFEIVCYGGIAALVIAAILSRVFLRLTLQPILSLTNELEKTDITNLSLPIQRSGNGDELDRLAVVFNRLKERLNLSFTQTREFTMSASHELKTPLSIMYATLEQMIGDEQLASHHRGQLDSLLEEVQRLTRISSQLTFLSKFDSDQMMPTFSRLNLEALVREMLEDIEIIASDRQIIVEILRCDELFVTGDRMMLRQLMIVLADNAVKYNCDQGLIEITLEKQQDSAILSMRNSGTTLPEPMWERVFERFFRGMSDVSSEVEGCGLGLSIAKAIVTAHSGRIDYTVSASGMNQICVRLPLAS